MSDIKFRLAKPSDAKQIANCHWHVRDRYSQGIFLSLGERFLRSYYKIILNDPYEVVICAECDNRILGFSSATLDGTKQAENLKRHKIQLGLSALSSLICKPSLIKDVWQRYRSLNSDSSSPSFIHADGVRGEYWCWLKDEEAGLASINLNKAKYEILYDLGCREMYFEVDKFNKAVFKYHTKISRAEPIEEVTLPDGRERVLFRKVLTR